MFLPLLMTNMNISRCITYRAAESLISDVEVKDLFKVVTDCRQMKHWDLLQQSLCLLP